jgi:hypothetical protein
MKTFPAPVRGWIRNESLSGGKDGGAYQLDNIFPLATGARLRKGSSKYATVGAGTRVGAIIPYVVGATKKLFAANTIAIYDITTVADPAVSPAAAVAGLTSEEWQFVQFTTSGGTYLRGVNGADTPQIYDGAAWTTVPAITGVTATSLSHVWQFKNRLFFVQANTTDAWYLATDAIGGVVTKFPLGGIFRLGGSLMFGSAWSVDTGSGKSEKCVFVSTEGEVAIYEGTDPASAASWALEGVYRIGRPLGKRAVFAAGGDLAIATDVGIVPLSQVLTTDLGALGGKAISHQIEDVWTTEVAQRVGTYPWHVQMWPTKQMLIVAMPSYSSLPKICFVANIRTGAWCQFTGWDTHCLGLYQDRMFFGTAAGLVVEAEVGGYDQTSAYTGAYVGLFSDLGTPSEEKQVTLIRPTTLSTQDPSDQATVSTDYIVSLPAAPSAAALIGGANSWDTGLWGTAVWSAGSAYALTENWRAATGIGSAIAPNWQVTIGQTAAPDIILVKIAVQYEMGQTPG